VGVDALTKRELEIAQRIVDRQTNRRHQGTSLIGDPDLV
jgi:hypothetical protein